MGAGWHRRCLFGSYGPLVVRGLCGYEVLALTPGIPFPPITHIVRRHPWVGVALMFALGHHFWVELEEALPEAVAVIQGTQPL